MDIDRFLRDPLSRRRFFHMSGVSVAGGSAVFLAACGDDTKQRVDAARRVRRGRRRDPQLRAGPRADGDRRLQGRRRASSRATCCRSASCSSSRSRSTPTGCRPRSRTPAASPTPRQVLLRLPRAALPDRRPALRRRPREHRDRRLHRRAAQARQGRPARDRRGDRRQRGRARRRPARRARRAAGARSRSSSERRRSAMSIQRIQIADGDADTRADRGVRARPPRAHPPGLRPRRRVIAASSIPLLLSVRNAFAASSGDAELLGVRDPAGADRGPRLRRRRSTAACCRRASRRSHGAFATTSRSTPTR